MEYSDLDVQAYAFDLFRRTYGVRALPEVSTHEWQECLEQALRDLGQL